jgi:hypothetical protein
MGDHSRARAARQGVARATIMVVGVACFLVFAGGAAAQGGDEARIREGERVRRDDLPHTAATWPVWLSPLVVVAGLACTSAGIALLIRTNEAQDVAHLSRFEGEAPGGSSSSRAHPPPPPPQTPPGGAGPDAHAPSAARVAAAWGAIGMRSRAPGARASSK